VMHKHEVRISFLRFVKLALPFAVMQLILAAGYLLLTS
jgi:Na+/H+ antiporter NhaD/arsenite permease-like protein